MANSVGTMKIFGGVQCAYVYAVSGALNAAQRASLERYADCPGWDLNTQFRIDFQNGLVAGNASFGDDPPTEFELWRKRNNDAWKLAGTVPGDQYSMMDYAVANDADYTYQVCPSSDTFVGVPIETGSVHTAFDGWTLMLVDNTDEDNVFKFSDAYYFQLNLEDASLQNNTPVTTYETFGRYKKAHRGTTNCWTISLHSLVGQYDCATHSYVDTVEWTDMIKDVTTDRRNKFLRDPQGRLMWVEPVSQLSLSQAIYSGTVANTQSIDFIEIASADDVVITD